MLPDPMLPGFTTYLLITGTYFMLYVGYDFRLSRLLRMRDDLLARAFDSGIMYRFVEYVWHRSHYAAGDLDARIDMALRMLMTVVMMFVFLVWDIVKHKR